MWLPRTVCVAAVKTYVQQQLWTPGLPSADAGTRQVEVQTNTV
jgi:hypothetical protein